MVHRRILGSLALSAAAVAGVAAPAHADDGGRGRTEECRGSRRATERCCSTRTDADRAGVAAETAGAAGRSTTVVLEDAHDRARALVGSSLGRRGRRVRSQTTTGCLPAPVVPEAPLGVLLPLAGATVLGAVVVVQRRRTSAAIAG